jgi:hypothetical protein
MGFYGVQRNEELLGNFLIRAALGNKPQYRELAIT